MTDEEAYGGPGIPRRAVTEATRSLSALLVAGLPLTRALETTRDVVRGDLADVLDAVLEEVKGGASFAHALLVQDGLFSPLYVGVVRAGERSGRLAGMMERLADELEKQDELRERIVSASIYPAALVTLGGISLFFLLLLVVPRFAELLEDAGAELPAMTAGLLSASLFVQTYWPYLVFGLAGVTLALAAYVQSPAGRMAASRGALSVPVLSSVRRELLAARFSRLLSVLLDGGAPVIAGLSDAAESLGDPAATAEVHRIREEVRIGTALSQSIGDGTLFPSELARLVAVGEESGRLSEFLSRAADLFERRSVRAMERAVTILEPVVIVSFGGLVAVVALALLQAIYGVNAGAFG